jgi:hypothetical protein
LKEDAGINGRIILTLLVGAAQDRDKCCAVVKKKGYALLSCTKAKNFGF